MFYFEIVQNCWLASRHVTLLSQENVLLSILTRNCPLHNGIVPALRHHHRFRHCKCSSKLAQFSIPNHLNLNLISSQFNLSSSLIHHMLINFKVSMTTKPMKVPSSSVFSFSFLFLIFLLERSWHVEQWVAIFFNCMLRCWWSFLLICIHISILSYKWSNSMIFNIIMFNYYWMITHDY